MNAFCLKCKFYFVTHDPTAPRGCKKFNIKTARFPSQLVKQQSGKECLAYEERISRKNRNLNDLKKDPY